jgi:hypothetical protein
VSLGYFEVRGVMSGGYLQGSGAERSVDSLIADYGDLLSYNREGDTSTYEASVAFIFRVNCHGCITKESLWTGGSYRNEAFPLSQRIANIVKVSNNVFVVYLEVG